eukprot:TRINITY_DN843_c0_g1_i2.p1 TRINITY_DN843_c0_g1~~TRINITY_DN843_c0_g1_i2.p1  ORF type:complete len:106 (-),score=30.75 TRINITY_DN843_c0_g1_i2:243-560(-)
MEMERKRMRWEREAKQKIAFEESEKNRRREQAMILNQIVHETSEGRNKHLSLKEKRKKAQQRRKALFKEKIQKLEEKGNLEKKRKAQEMEKEKIERSKKRLKLKK